MPYNHQVIWPPWVAEVLAVLVVLAVVQVTVLTSPLLLVALLAWMLYGLGLTRFLAHLSRTTGSVGKMPPAPIIGLSHGGGKHLGPSRLRMYAGLDPYLGQLQPLQCFLRPTSPDEIHTCPRRTYMAAAEIGVENRKSLLGAERH